MESGNLNDEHWVALRDAVPSYATAWNAIRAADDYKDDLPFVTIHDFAEHIVAHVVLQRPEELKELAHALETDFTKAMLRDDGDYAGLIRVGLLEGLITVADECGMPLTRFVPLLQGQRTRDQWNQAIAWQRPGFRWDDNEGEQPSFPPPRPVGTVEIHRGRRIDSEQYAVDVRLLSGALTNAAVLRRESGKHFWLEWAIIEVRRRSPDLPDEYELILRDKLREEFDWWEYLLRDDSPYWQLATGFVDPSEAT